MASAIRCVSSRFLTALPRLLDASSSSAESRSIIVFSLRSRAAAMIQRMPSAWRRDGAHFDRHLIGGAADAARAHLDRGHHVVERLLEHRERVLLGLAFDLSKAP